MDRDASLAIGSRIQLLPFIGRGERTNSDERFPDNAEDNFENSKTDTFTVDARDLGELKGVFIRHDNSGHRPGWFLDRVVVFDDRQGREWTFPCNRWLARDEDDRQISRYLSVAT